MTQGAIRILLVDDQTLFREGMRSLLSSQRDLDVVGEAGDGEEALRQAARLRPDVVLMDLRMPRLDDVAATRRLRAEQPACRVIALTTFDDDEYVFKALRAGAAGYLLKNISSAKLFEAIRVTAQDESFLQPSVAAKVVAEFARLSAAAPPPWLNSCPTASSRSYGWWRRVRPTGRLPLGCLSRPARSRTT